LICVGCSASSAATDIPPDAGAGSDGRSPEADAAVLGPQAIPGHVFAVHAAHTQPSIGDLRLCPSADSSPARPDDNRVPRSNYPGVPAGGFAELENPGMWTAPFALDAYDLGMAEGQKPIKCSDLWMNNIYVKTKLSPVMLPTPGILAVVDTNGDAGAPDGGMAPEVLAIAVAPMAEVPAVQIVTLSRELVGPKLVAGFGPLDGKCPVPAFYDGPATYGAALSAPTAFAPPASDFDSAGLKVCAGNMNKIVLQKSWAELQQASVADTIPSELYARKALFVVVLLGDTGAASPEYALHAVVLPFNVTK
jgi:hypothetical protein